MRHRIRDNCSSFSLPCASSSERAMTDAIVSLRCHDIPVAASFLFAARCQSRSPSLRSAAQKWCPIVHDRTTFLQSIFYLFIRAPSPHCAAVSASLNRSCGRSPRSSRSHDSLRTHLCLRSPEQALRHDVSIAFRMHLIPFGLSLSLLRFDPPALEGRRRRRAASVARSSRAPLPATEAATWTTCPLAQIWPQWSDFHGTRRAWRRRRAQRRSATRRGGYAACHLRADDGKQARDSSPSAVFVRQRSEQQRT